MFDGVEWELYVSSEATAAFTQTPPHSPCIGNATHSHRALYLEPNPGKLTSLLRHKLISHSSFDWTKRKEFHLLDHGARYPS